MSCPSCMTNTYMTSHIMILYFYRSYHSSPRLRLFIFFNFRLMSSMKEVFLSSTLSDIGSIVCGEREFTEIGSEYQIENQSDKTMSIECGVGEVNVQFQAEQ